MEVKYKVIKEFPKGGALARKGKGPVVFLKNYWCEELKEVYLEEQSIKEGPKGLYIDEWEREASLTLEDIISPENFTIVDGSKKLEVSDNGEVAIVTKKIKKIPMIYKGEWDYKKDRKYEELLKEWLGVDSLSIYDAVVSIPLEPEREVLSEASQKKYHSSIKRVNDLFARNKKTFFPFPYWDFEGRIRKIFINKNKEESELKDSFLKVESGVKENEEKLQGLLEKFKKAESFKVIVK